MGGMGGWGDVSETYPPLSIFFFGGIAMHAMHAMLALHAMHALHALHALHACSSTTTIENR